MIRQETAPNTSEYDLAAEQLATALHLYEWTQGSFSTPYVRPDLRPFAHNTGTMEGFDKESHRFSDDKVAIIACPRSTVTGVLAPQEGQPGTYTLFTRRFIIDIDTAFVLPPDSALATYELKGEENLAQTITLQKALDAIEVAQGRGEGELPEGITSIDPKRGGYIGIVDWASPYSSDRSEGFISPEKEVRLKAETVDIATRMVEAVSSLGGRNPGVWRKIGLLLRRAQS